MKQKAKAFLLSAVDERAEEPAKAKRRYDKDYVGSLWPALLRKLPANSHENHTGHAKGD